jgi:hypothetical protein
MDIPRKKGGAEGVPGVWRHGAGGDPPPMPQCVGLSCRFSGRADRLEGGPGFSRDGRHVSGWGPESGRAARAVRGRGGRLRATYTRSRDALSGSTGNGFVSGALLPLVALRRFGVSVWFAMVRFGVTRRPSRIVALCRAACQGDPGGAGHFSRVSGCIRVVWGLIRAG